MPEITQVEMTEYLRGNLPYIMMTMEDAQGRNLWDKYGSMDLRTGVFWNIGKLPPGVLKKVWDYTYTLFMQEKTNPGVLKYQADLGRIRYELGKVGWRWGGSHYSQGVCHETFRKGDDLLKLQYGYQDDVIGEAGARPPAGDMNYMSHYPLSEIVPALMKAQWVYQGHAYSQGVYYANLLLTPFMIHLEVGGEGEVVGGNPDGKWVDRAAQEWRDYIKKFETEQLRGCLEAGRVEDVYLDPQLRQIFEREYAGREKLWAIEFDAQRWEQGTMFVRAITEEDARSDAEGFDYEDIVYDSDQPPASKVEIKAVYVTTEDRKKRFKAPAIYR